MDGNGPTHAMKTRLYKSSLSKLFVEYDTFSVGPIPIGN